MHDPLASLRKLAAYLKPTGRTSLTSSSSGPLGLQTYTLTYQTSGNVPFTWPVTGAADFTISYDESTREWSCAGQMFGVSPAGNEPKTWFHSVGQGVKSREQVIKGFLQRASMIWERYRGDLDHFAYRLGIEMAATGTMTKTDTGYCWTHTSHPDIQVHFSPDPNKPGYGMLPQVRLGFYAPVKMHVWFMSMPNLAQLRESVAEFSHTARTFCEGASACMVVADAK